MDITDYTKSVGGDFLRAEDVLSNPALAWTITAEGAMVENSFKNLRLHLPVKCGENEKLFDCSKTNAKFIGLTLNAEDSLKWIGKSLIFETYKMKNSDGKMIDAINVKEVK